MRPWCLKIAPTPNRCCENPFRPGAFQAGISHSRQGWHPPHSFAGEPGTEQTGRSGAAVRDQHGYDRGEAAERGAVPGKERLHITLDSIGEAVLCTDIDMNITFMNPVAEKMSGWSQSEALGQPVLKVLHITFGENGPLMENIHSGDMSRTDIEQDVVLNCRNGGSFDIHYSITPSALWKVTPSARCW